MKIIGVLLITNTVGLVAYYCITGTVDTKRLSALAAIGIIAGILLLIADRVTNVKVTGLGEVNAAAERIVSGADNIQEIQKEVEGHRDSIRLIVRDANEAREQINRIDELAKNAKKKSDDLEKTVADAERARAEIEATSEFNILVTQLGADNRAAFHKLMQIANEGNEPFKSMAMAALVTVATSTLNSLQIDISQWDKFAFDPDKATLAEYQTFILRKGQRPDVASSAVSKLWSQDRFPKKERLEALIDFLKNTESVRVLHRVCIVLNLEAKIDKNILAWGEYLHWWETNANVYKDK